VNKLAGIKIYDMQCNQNLAAACMLPAACLRRAQCALRVVASPPTQLQSARIMHFAEQVALAKHVVLPAI
jgi:hypothetical protein